MYCIVLYIVIEIKAHICHSSECPFPANTTRWNNDVLMLAQRLRRWPNIKTSLFQRVVSAGLAPRDDIFLSFTCILSTDTATDNNEVTWFYLWVTLILCGTTKWSRPVYLYIWQWTEFEYKLAMGTFLTCFTTDCVAYTLIEMHFNNPFSSGTGFRHLKSSPALK